MNATNRLLMKIAAVGGIVTCSAGLLLNSRMQGKVREAPYYKASVGELRSNRGALQLLGEPVREGNFIIRSQNADEGTINFEVNLKGQRQKGVLYVWMNRKTATGDWNIDRIELGLNDEPDRRLLIRDDGATLETDK